MAYLDCVRVFIRVYELGSLSAAGRDKRLSPAVVSNRIRELEKHLGVRLFVRTTRKLAPTEQGRLFYDGARRIVAAVTEAEAAVSDITRGPGGSVHVAAPLGLGKRVIAPLIPAFHALYDRIEIRLRLTDRRVDLTEEGLDAAFQLGVIEDSALTMRSVADCARVLCAAPAYLERAGAPRDIADLTANHACLMLRFPGSREFTWTLETPEGPRKAEVRGPFDSDDGDVLTAWALDGCGIVMKPVFEVAGLLAAGRLVPVLTATPPVPVRLAWLSPHRTLMDPKVRLFADYTIPKVRRRVAELAGGA